MCGPSIASTRSARCRPAATLHRNRADSVVVTIGGQALSRKTMARVGWHALCGIALVAVAFFYRYLSFTDFSNDHFVNLSMAQQVVGFGAVPVRDFVERGWPLTTLGSGAGTGVGAA